MARHLLLNHVLGTQPAWQHPDAPIHRVTTLEYYLEQARIAERGRFDLLFLVDDVALFPDPDVALSWPLSPIQVMTALATHTSHIGLVATAGTGFHSPYELARSLASLDHLSGGRAGWNIVTSSSGPAAVNHGLDETRPRAERYRQARECIDAMCQLWHAWDEDAVVADPATGRLVNPDKIHAINFAGRHVRLRGPLSLPRSPQAVPVLCQAGPSPAGRELAGRYADLVYARFDSVEESREYRADLRGRAAAAGRGADAVRLLPGVMPYVKSTEAEARRFHRELTELSPSAHRYGHRAVVGTPERIADLLTDGFRRGAFDGVSVSAPPLPTGLADFVDLVVPILQDRGVHQREYPEGTLRERLGLPVTQRVDRSGWTGHYAS